MKFVEFLNEKKATDKPYYGEVNGIFYAINVDGAPNSLPELPFGKHPEKVKGISDFIKDADSETLKIGDDQNQLKEIKKWISSNKVSEFYSKWKESDTSIKIHYK